jgi:hypothetical protein
MSSPMKYFGKMRSARSGRQRPRGHQTARRPAAGLSLLLESLEARRVMTATPMAIETISWNGRSVEVKDDSYVFRVDAANKTTATNLTAMRFNAPSLQSGWSAKPLGYGYYSLTAPGTSLATVQSWAKRAGVATVEPNFVVSNSGLQNTLERPAPGGSRTVTASGSAAVPGMGSQFLAAVDPDLPSQWGLTKIQAQAAWAKTRGSSNVIVAVMDSGIQADHPDLAANMWTRPASVPIGLSGVNGYDFLNNDDIPEDTTGGGTAMAGVIGAVGGNDTGAQGISGVSPTVRIYAAKVNAGSSSTTTIDTTIAAMLRIVQLKTEYFQPFEAVVAANSTILNFESAVEREAIRTLGSVGILYVVNAGDAVDDPNSGALGLDLDNSDSFPSNYSDPKYGLNNVLTVAATNQADEKRIESRHGNERIVQISAPGDQILTTLPGGTYGPRSGTALAAAHVAGVAALLKAYRSDARTADIKKAILDGADRIAGLTDFVQEGRRLNADKALSVLQVSTPTPGGLVPTVSISNVSMIEGHAGFSSVAMTFRLNQPAAPNRPVSVSYATVNGSAFAGLDYVAQSGVVSFTGFEMEKTVQFRGIGNRRPDDNRSFNVVLNAATSRNVIVPPTNAATVTILDDDITVPTLPTQGSTLLPRLSVAPKYASGTTTFAEGSLARFEVSLDRASDKAVMVKYRTADVRTQANFHATPNLDYKSVSGTLVFKPGELLKTITVQTLADSVDDPNEKIDIILSEPVNAALGTALPAILGVAAPPTQPPSGSGFTITVKFSDNSLTSSQQAVFQQAAARWSEIITGDLPDVTDNGTVIDDVQIDASAPAIDGVGGILGQAGPTAIRSGRGGLPYKGAMQFDSADVARMESNGTFSSVILHEMAHVLGVGSLWQNFNLLVGAGSSNPVFTGSNALREYNSIFGTNATGVPVENTGGQGTRDGHWRESIFKTELMTGYAEQPGTPMPISRITVGQFQDLGYTVDYAKADSYSKPAITAVAAAAGAGSFRLIMPAAIPTPKPAASQPAKPSAATVPVKLVVPEVRQLSPAVPISLPVRSAPAVSSAQPGKIVAKASAFASLGAAGIS